MMNNHAVTLLMVCLGATLVGCGQYVSYGEEGPPRGGPVTVEVPELGEVDALNHYAFAGLVASFAAREGGGEDVLIDYARWAEDDEARFLLEDYLVTLAAVDPSSLGSPQAQLAYWINAYNASVIQGVLERFEGDLGFSVIESPGFFSDRVYVLGGVALSLDQIEQGVIRGDFDREGISTGVTEEERAQMERWHEELWGGEVPDARYHAVVNCGALGCPNLLAEAPFAYQAERLDEQLERATRAWLASARKGAGPDGVSMLFEWYEEDFARDAGSVEAFIEAHRDGGAGGVDLDARLDYDWTLNTTR